MNDTIVVRFEYNDPRRHDIDFDRAVDVIHSIQKTFDECANLYRKHRSEGGDQISSVVLVGGPRIGSIEFIFNLVLVPSIIMGGIIVSKMYKNDMVHLDRIQKSIAISSIITLALFSSFGRLAELTNQVSIAPDEKECKVAHEFSGLIPTEINAFLQQNVDAARRSGCDRVTIQVRGYDTIELSRGIVDNEPKLADSPETKKPADTGHVVINPGPILKVWHDEQIYNAVVATVKSRFDERNIVLVIKSDNLEPGLEFGATGKWVDSSEFRILGENREIPEAFRTASGVYLVNQRIIPE